MVLVHYYYRRSKQQQPASTTSICANDNDSVRSVNAVGGKTEIFVRYIRKCSTKEAQRYLQALLQRPDIGPLGFIDTQREHRKGATVSELTQTTHFA